MRLSLRFASDLLLIVAIITTVIIITIIIIIKCYDFFIVSISLLLVPFLRQGKSESERLNIVPGVR